MGRPLVTFTVAGSVINELSGTNYPNEQPFGWRRIQTAPVNRRGRGVQYRITMSAQQAMHMAWHLESCIDVLETMTAEERGASRLPPMRNAVVAIRTAVRESR